MPTVLSSLPCAIKTALMAFNDLNERFDTTGCDAPLAVCNRQDLGIATASFTLLWAIIQQERALGGTLPEGLGATAAQISGLLSAVEESADDTGCDAPYTVVAAYHWGMTQGLCEKLRDVSRNLD